MQNKTEIISNWLKVIFNFKDLEINSIYFLFEKESKNFKILLRTYNTHMSTGGLEKKISNMQIFTEHGKHPLNKNSASHELESYFRMSQIVEMMMSELSNHQKEDWGFISSWSSHGVIGSHPFERIHDDQIDSIAFYKGEHDIFEFKKQLPYQSIH